MRYDVSFNRSLDTIRESVKILGREIKCLVKFIRYWALTQYGHLVICYFFWGGDIHR